jgi:hypothetical protein
MGPKKTRNVALTDLCHPTMCINLSLQHGHHNVLDASEERSTTHDTPAGSGARGGWMSMYETGVMPDSTRSI